MRKQARLPEIFDQILNNTPVLEFGSRTPPPQNWNSSQSPSLTLPRTSPESRTPPQIENSWFSFQSPNLTLPQNIPPPKLKTLDFLSRVQIWPYPEAPPPKLKTLIFFPDSKTSLTENTPSPPPKIENSKFLSRFQN